tara:strand:- start:127 stop:246 length:120 start_codon:yes stop_codon:yes gene_type:complete
MTTPNPSFQTTQSSALFTIGYRIKLEDYNAIFDEASDSR